MFKAINQALNIGCWWVIRRLPENLVKIIQILSCLVIFAGLPSHAFPQSWEALDIQYESYKTKERYTDALSVAQKTLDSAEQQYGVNTSEYHKSLRNMAESHMFLGQWDKSLHYYKEILRREISRLAAINLSMSTTIQSITTLYDLLHDKKAATTVYQKASLRLSQLKAVDHTIYTELSDYYTQALMSQAAPTVSQSLEMVAKQTGVDMSAMQQTVDQYSEGLSAASNVNRPTIDHKNQGSIQELQKTCTKNKNYSNFSGGISSCTKLYELSIKMGEENSIEHARTCFDLGYFYMLSSKHENSVKYYLEGIEIWEKNRYHQNQKYVEALYNASSSLQIDQRYELATTLLQKAEKVSTTLEETGYSLYPGILSMLASMQRIQGKYREAESSYDRYRDYYLARKNSDPAVWLSYYLGVGLVYEQMGKWQEADKVYTLYNKTTIELITDLFQYVTLSSEKKVAQNFVGFKYNQDFFYSYCLKRILHNFDLIGQMYNSELLTKGLVLRTLQKKAEAILRSGNAKVIKDFEQWLDVRQKIAKLSLLSISDRKIDVDSLEREIKQLEDRMMAWLLTNKQIEKLGLDWKNVQNELLANDAAIEFIQFQNFDLSEQKWSDQVLYAALIIRPGHTHPQFINLFEEAEFETFLKDTNDPSPFEQIRKMYTWLPGQYGGIYKGDTLYKLVWKKLEPHLKGVEKIYYSPAGLLHKISFDAIPIAEQKTLISQYNLQRLSTTGLLADKQSDFYFSQSDQTLLFGGMHYDLDHDQQKIIGRAQGNAGSKLFIRDRSFDWTRSKAAGGAWPYLAGSLDEVTGIGALLQANKRKHQTLTGDRGQEERFKRVSNNPPEIIHIATHGFFIPADSPKKNKKLLKLQAQVQIDPDETFKRSGLLFAGANTTWLGNDQPDGLEDGILTSYEISKLNLTKTKLVVLSACETGLGEVGGGEGVYGLQRAFKLAGVDNIIMSLWQIPDAQTVELMDIFYSQWLTGKTLKEAFHNAQEKMSANYEPYFWGAFVLLQ